MAYAFIDVTLQSLVVAFALIAVLAAMAVWFVYKWQQGADDAKDKQIKNYRGLYESERDARTSAEEKNERLVKELAATRADLEKAEGERDECAKTCLRILARQDNLEKCIHELQRLLNVPLTNFEDPTKTYAKDISHG